jgi:hypothetical protein
MILLLILPIGFWGAGHDDWKFLSLYEFLEVLDQTHLYGLTIQDSNQAWAG